MSHSTFRIRLVNQVKRKNSFCPCQIDIKVPPGKSCALQAALLNSESKDPPAEISDEIVKAITPDIWAQGQ